VNPVFDPTGEFGTTVDQVKLDAAASAIGAIVVPSGLLALMSTTFNLTQVRLEVRDDVSDDLIALSIKQRTANGLGTGTPMRGAQNALVFSLRTDVPGGSGRGRMYWPCIAESVTTFLRINTPAQTAALADMVTYLHAIENAMATAFATIGFDLAVRSKTTKTTPHVNRIQLGNVMDTQRRRRDNIIEDYLSAAF
jgi:hypothetical protein